MPVYLISGPNGSGKSTVGSYLKARGFSVVEADQEPGLSAWADNDTRLPVAKSDIPEYPFTESWLAAHSWLWDGKRLQEIIAQEQNDTLFICGGAYNEKDFYDLFDKRFGLWVPNEVMIKRLQSRGPARWREGSVELAEALEWNQKFKAFFVARGGVVIDSVQSPDAVIDEIMSHI